LEYLNLSGKTYLMKLSPPLHLSKTLASRQDVGWWGQVTEAISNGYGTIAILHKQSTAAAGKTVCLVLSTEHYPELIDKQDVR
jgi:hypothetical protein